MVKRLVDIEEQLLEDARQALGTDTIKDTVATALRQAVAARRRAQVDDAALRRFAAAAADLGDDDVMTAAWQ